METPYSRKADNKLVLTVVEIAIFVLVAIAAVAILLSQNVKPATQTVKATSATTTHVSLDIMPVKPGGPVEDWPAYIASTPLTVPANSTVTVTIRNFDLGDAALAANSPLANVQGTVGGTALFNGTQYSSLDAAKVSHTFTIPQLGLNVPIPGDTPDNASFLTVTFSFHTGKAGTYTFQCYSPCGTGTDGFGGPMGSMAYMKGTLTVQG
jgi:heme/copper-type cytochrome/quinol oxidase subunit 2